MKRLFTFLMVVIIPSVLAAQEPEMADVMRSEGKIYVVVAILLTILIGVILYLVMLDRKVSKIEKQIDSKKR